MPLLTSASCVQDAGAPPDAVHCPTLMSQYLRAAKNLLTNSESVPSIILKSFLVPAAVHYIARGFSSSAWCCLEEGHFVYLALVVASLSLTMTKQLERHQHKQDMHISGE